LRASKTKVTLIPCHYVGSCAHGEDFDRSGDFSRESRRVKVLSAPPRL